MNLTDDEMRVKCAEAMGDKIFIYQVILCWPDPTSNNFWSSGTWESREVAEREAAAMIASGRVLKEIVEHRNNIPNYPSSVDAALTLCDRLREEGFGVVIVGPSNHGNWFVDFTNKGTIYRSEDPSLARAICLAFLRVRGLDSVARSL